MYNRRNNVLARNLRRRMTPWERKLWYNFLNSHQLKFYRQRSIGSYIVDFYCASVKLVIELDGGGHFTKLQKEKDKVRNKYLEEQGITVMRITNDEVWDNFEGTCEAIELKIQSLQNK